jgi:hypothetical protein
VNDSTSSWIQKCILRVDRPKWHLLQVDVPLVHFTLVATWACWAEFGMGCLIWWFGLCIYTWPLSNFVINIVLWRISITNQITTCGLMRLQHMDKPDYCPWTNQTTTCGLIRSRHVIVRVHVATSVSNMESSHVSVQRGTESCQQLAWQRTVSAANVASSHVSCPACTVPRGGHFHDEISDDAHWS